ncbi:MAG: hypothetical protein E7294_04000 [Lachnospiraceae bacterium]|jgi:hypothetical protein|nr:hypothetical protein [Lachnospiraceae bacterium]
MKETLYTIPLTDAFQAHDECPFCFVERNVEQDLLDLVLGSGSSYMESDMREKTDHAGFCRAHFKKMFDYGNTLGNGWILKTHYLQMQKEFDKQVKMFSPAKAGFMNKLKKNEFEGNSMSQWVAEKNRSCYICQEFDKMYDRYLDTFFFMYTKDNEMTEMIKNSKGFCLTHFGDLCRRADLVLNDRQKAAFYPLLFGIMKENLARLSGDVSWLVDKFDYRNKDADWKNSRDAIQRGMQKLKGGYPADPVYKQSK